MKGIIPKNYYIELSEITTKIANKLKEISESDNINLHKEQEKLCKLIILLEDTLEALRSFIIFYYRNADAAFINSPIKLDYKEDGTLIIKLPRFLPVFRDPYKNGGYRPRSDKFICNALVYAIENTIPQKILYRINKKTKKALIYIHYYKEGCCVTNYLNDDALTVKDILQGYFLYDTSPLYLEVHNLSRLANENYTEVILTDVNNVKYYI